MSILKTQTCPQCGGNGIWYPDQGNDGVCYTCGGRGYIPAHGLEAPASDRKVKVYPAVDQEAYRLTVRQHEEFDQKRRCRETASLIGQIVWPIREAVSLSFSGSSPSSTI